MTILFLIFSANIDDLLLYFSAASWVFYSLVFAGVLISRHRNPTIDRSFMVWRFIPYLMLIISILVIFLGFLCDWRQSLISISIILFTIPCYFFFVYKGGIIPSVALKAFGTDAVLNI
uniref:Cystine/glutamate transporter (Trinotate prediction) n=1 Tax=Myxobolus squamalis TaxID=59785 RepID=A0A6B2FYK8_MYXSQ